MLERLLGGSARRVSCALVAATLGAVPAFAEPVVDLAKATFTGAAAGTGGPAISLDMGTKRVNWTNARWSVCALPAAKDLSKAAGIKITVTSPKPRSDAGVYLAVREANGAWWVHPWAANLTQATNGGVALFKDFSTADYTAPSAGDGKDTHVDKTGLLETSEISHIAVGCINPLGVGKVDFTVTELATESREPEVTIPATVSVSGKLLDINGTTAIPAGVFGGFHSKWQVDGKTPWEAFRLAQDRRINAGPTFGTSDVTWMMINTWGDRTGRSPRLTNPNWEADVAKQANAAVEAAKATGKPLFVEWWNEPYLNWSNKNRVIFNTDNYNLDEAKEGGEVKLKIDGTVAPHLKWTQNYDAPPWNWCQPRFAADRDGVMRDNWRRGKDASGRMWSTMFPPPPGGRGGYNTAYHPPRDTRDGEKYTVKQIDNKTKATKDVELTAFTPWYIYDETQFTFWSAAGTRKFYNDPMVVVGKTLKAGLPSATYIAGWGFRPSEDHWAAWDLDYKPTIDAGHEYIDGICDHDYGGEPTKMSANYEVVTAYGKTKYNKWLTGWNTEAAASVDPQAYAGAEGSGGADPVKYVWGARKLIHTLAFESDKARAISWFLEGNSFVTEKGEGTALLLLKNLRGKLVQVNSSDPKVWAVASVDGSDPRNPRPADMPRRQEMVVAVWNDHLEPRQVEFTFAPPAGTKFAGVLTRQVRIKEGVPAIEEKGEEGKAPANPMKFGAQMGGREVLVLTFPLTGEVAADAKPEATRTQFFSPEVVQNVTPEKALSTSIKVDAAALGKAKRVAIRFVAERLAEGEGVVTVNGKEFALPACVSPENNPLVREFVVEASDIKAENAVVFKAKPGHAGYFLGMSSILVDAE